MHGVPKAFFLTLTIPIIVLSHSENTIIGIVRVKEMFSCYWLSLVDQEQMRLLALSQQTPASKGYILQEKLY